MTPHAEHSHLDLYDDAVLSLVEDGGRPTLQLRLGEQTICQPWLVKHQAAIEELANDLSIVRDTSLMTDAQREDLQHKIQRLGARLCDTLLGGELGDAALGLLHRKRGADGSEEPERWLRLRLALPPRWEWVPWEAAFASAWQDREQRPRGLLEPALLLNERISMTRHLPGLAFQELSRLAVDGPLRVTMVTCAHPGRADYPPLDDVNPLGHELAGLLTSMAGKGTVEYSPSDWLAEPSRDQVIRYLGEQKERGRSPHVLIYAGHGSFIPGGGASLVLRAADGQPSDLEADQLAALIQGTEARLVMVFSCAHAGVLGRALCAAGVPATVAYNRIEPTEDPDGRWTAGRGLRGALAETTLAGVRSLLARLLNKDSVDAAVHAARVAARDAAGVGSAEWFKPMLYLSAADGYLFGSEDQIMRGQYLNHIYREGDRLSVFGLPDPVSLAKSYIPQRLAHWVEVKDDDRGPSGF